MEHVGTRLECFFEQSLLEMEETTARVQLHQPIRQECVLRHDAPWEGDGSDYHVFFWDEGRYRMYYLGWAFRGEAPVVCYAESRDGLHWEKPNLGICEYAGSKDNNIVMNRTMHPSIDNFYVYKDENPACLPEERYKALASYSEGKGGMEDPTWGLWLFVSPDGLHFTRAHCVTNKGAFDSLNSLFWDARIGKYRCYYRGYHPAPAGTPCSPSGNDIRDIRYTETVDCRHFSEGRFLQYGGKEEIPLYTNNIQPYYRAKHLYVGFPARYIERISWGDSFEELGGKEKRRDRMQDCGRYGLVTTDAVFMCSRDGVDFRRYDESFLPPAPENGRNWAYGDSYFAYGMLETPSPIDSEPEISLYAPCNHWMGIPAELHRYTIRRDGFVSLRADGEEKTVLTKPFTYEGNTLYVNFSTSAWGHAYFSLVDENNVEYRSEEHFGNTTNRRIRLPEDAVAKNAGKPVRLKVRLRDADFYAFRFAAE